MRAAFRDLKEQVRLDTDEVIDLEELLEEYSEAWHFYDKHLARRANPEELAFQLLLFYYSPDPPTNLNSRTSQIFQQVLAQDISIPFLISFLLKAIPGYVSRDGDATDMSHKYEAVMQLLERFTSNTRVFTSLPALVKARQEKKKTRLMLIYHTREVLEIYNDLTHPQGIYDTADYVKQQTMALDLDGFWNECKGRNEHTHFWQFVEADNNTGHFMFHWEKLADGTMRHTPSSSPSATRAEAISSRSTFSSLTRRRAIFFFSWAVKETPFVCSPSRRVVSMISIMGMVEGF